MKKKIHHSVLIILIVCASLTSCKKDNYVITTAPPSPAKGAINFHIKDTNLLGWGEPIFLYRLVFTPTANYYDSSQNIYLRPNIDTTFIYPVDGNTRNLFTVGGAPFDGILIYMEQKFIAAGSNINWEIEY